MCMKLLNMKYKDKKPREKKTQIERILIGGSSILLFLMVALYLIEAKYGGQEYFYKVPYDDLEVYVIASRKTNKTIFCFKPISADLQYPDYLVYNGYFPYLEVIIDLDNPSSLLFNTLHSKHVKSGIHSSHFEYYTPLFEDYWEHLKDVSTGSPKLSAVEFNYELKLNCTESHFVGDSIVTSYILQRSLSLSHPSDSSSIETEKRHRRGRWSQLILPAYSHSFIVFRKAKLKDHLPFEIKEDLYSYL